MVDTFAELESLEPRLGMLLKEIKSLEPATILHECWQARWYGVDYCAGYKWRMMELVGWVAETDNKILKESRFYDLAYSALLSAIPGCEECHYYECPTNPEYKGGY